MVTKDLLIKNLGEIVSRVRKRRRITLEDLAKATGTSPMTVQRVEMAQGGTRLDNLIAIIQGLDLRLVDLFKEIEGEPREINGLNPAWEEVTAKVNTLTPVEREWLAQVFLKIMEKPN